MSDSSCSRRGVFSMRRWYMAIWLFSPRISSVEAFDSTLAWSSCCMRFTMYGFWGAALSRGQAHRLVDVGQALGDELPPLAGPAVVLVGHRELLLQALERAEVGLALLGQLAHVLLFVGGDALLLLLELRARLAELPLQKLGGARGHLFAELDVLLDVEGGQLIGDVHRDPRIAGAVGDGEHHGARLAAAPALGISLDLELDVLAHPLDGLVHAEALPYARIEAVALDDRGQAGPAHDLLAHADQLAF